MESGRFLSPYFSLTPRPISTPNALLAGTITIHIILSRVKRTVPTTRPQHVLSKEITITRG